MRSSLSLTTPQVRMIASESPVVFAKACEMFVLELTMRSWSHAEENKRRTLQVNTPGSPPLGSCAQEEEWRWTDW